MGGVLTGGREAWVACRPNFKPLACLVAEISADVMVSQGPTIGFRCEPAVHYTIDRCKLFLIIKTSVSLQLVLHFLHSFTL